MPRGTGNSHAKGRSQGFRALRQGHRGLEESGLTRFSGKENSFMVSSAQGGGFKDTWVLNS